MGTLPPGKLCQQHIQSVTHGTSLASQGLRLCASDAGGVGLIPGRGSAKRKTKSVIHKPRQRLLLENPPGDGLPWLSFSKPSLDSYSGNDHCGETLAPRPRPHFQFTWEEQNHQEKGGWREELPHVAEGTAAGMPRVAAGGRAAAGLPL